MSIRYWDIISKVSNDKDKKNSWRMSLLYGLSILIGFTAAAIVIGLFFLLIGFPFSLLWNYTISSIFEVSEINSLVGGAFLFLVFAFFRLIKFAFKH